MQYDVLIVGGGPAGLSAALLLGRARRHVLVCDAGRPRNARARTVNGFFSRDGVPPRELLRTAREQLEAYPSVQVRDTEVVDARQLDGGFELTLNTGERLTSRMLLLATGVVDQLPPFPGAEEYYGRSVFHCPYCDGWEMRDQPLGVYGPGHQGISLALELTLWSGDLVLFTHGQSKIEERDEQRLKDRQIRICQEPIVRLEGRDGVLERVVLASGEAVPRRAIFFSTGFVQHSPLAEKLGCDFSNRGAVDTGEYENTSVPGLFVAGDASRDVQLVIVAAAEGAKAAFAINKALMKHDLR